MRGPLLADAPLWWVRSLLFGVRLKAFASVVVLLQIVTACAGGSLWLTGGCCLLAGLMSCAGTAFLTRVENQIDRGIEWLRWTIRIGVWLVPTGIVIALWFLDEFVRGSLGPGFVIRPFISLGCVLLGAVCFVIELRLFRDICRRLLDDFLTRLARLEQIGLAFSIGGFIVQQIWSRFAESSFSRTLTMILAGLVFFAGVISFVVYWVFLFAVSFRLSEAASIASE